MRRLYCEVNEAPMHLPAAPPRARRNIVLTMTSRVSFDAGIGQYDIELASGCERACALFAYLAASIAYTHLHLESDALACVLREKSIANVRIIAAAYEAWRESDESVITHTRFTKDRTTAIAQSRERAAYMTTECTQKTLQSMNVEGLLPWNERRHATTAHVAALAKLTDFVMIVTGSRCVDGNFWHY
jgi:hypothetical protein